MSVNKRVLVVGAGGFAGGWFVERGLETGCEVWAGVRESTSRERLGDPRLHIVNFDFEDPSTLADTMIKALPEGEKWDWIIYNLGATKVKRYADFNRINHDYLRNFTEALKKADKVPEKLLYMSSLSVMGNRDGRSLGPLTEEMVPLPDTRYGASKLKAELTLVTSGIPYIIFRATGIYGPWDHDYFLMMESIAKGFDFGVGFRSQHLTFIYASDLADAAYMALEKGKTGEIYNIAEERSYTQSEFRSLVMKEIGKKIVLPVKLPIWAVGIVCAISEKIGAARGKPATLNSDKFRIMKQRDWRCSTSKAERDFGFKAQVPLAEGVARSVKWYKEKGWL